MKNIFLVCVWIALALMVLVSSCGSPTPEKQAEPTKRLKTRAEIQAEAKDKRLQWCIYYSRENPNFNRGSLAVQYDRCNELAEKATKMPANNKAFAHASDLADGSPNPDARPQ